MRTIEAVRRLIRNSDRAEEIKQGIANQSDLLNRKLDALIQGQEHLAHLFDSKLSAAIAELANKPKLDAVFEEVRTHLSAAVDGFADQWSLVHRSLELVIDELKNHSKLLDARLSAAADAATVLNDIIELQKGQLVMQREQTEAIDALITSIATNNQRPVSPASVSVTASHAKIPGSEEWPSAATRSNC